MEKIILSKRVAVAIEEALKLHQENKGLILKKHCAICFYHYEDWTGDNFQYLNELSLEEMAIALYVGYEVEETPEEKISKKFEEYHDISCSSPITKEQWYANGFQDGLRFFAYEFDIKIKGINA